jgi:hypothetical protein
VKSEVDLHTIGGRITEYPYEDYLATYDQTINAWVNFLNKFGDKIYAIELKNEPHGTCTFNDFITWCNSAINEIESRTKYKGLYFISGTQYSLSEQDMNHAWGGTFSDISESNFPMDYLDRIVLCPHVYGTSVRSDAVSEDSSDIWNKAFGFIKDKNWLFKGLPIIFTEIGGFLIGSDGEYYNRFLEWAEGEKLNKGLYWWTLPTTSIDTGGIFLDDNMSELNWTKINFIKEFIKNPTYI